MQNQSASPLAKITPGRIGRAVIESQSFYLLLIIFALGAVAQVINPKFLSMNNIRSILGQVSTLGIVSTGVMVLIVSGSFDISIGSIIGFSATMLCLAIKHGASDFVGCMVGLGVAVACSTLNGVLSVLFRAPSFIISLATASLYTGLCLTITGGGNVTVFNRMEFFAGTYVLGGIPLLFIISLLCYVLVGLMLKHTQFGRRVYAIGSNPNASFLAGIRVDLNRILFFVVSGVTTGVAVMMMVSRLGAAQSSTGAGTELQAMGAVIIGGVAINGGSGKMFGTFCGVLLTGVIFNALNLMKVSPYLQDIAFGLLILLSIAISSIRARITK